MKRPANPTRRTLLKTAAAGLAAPAILPRGALAQASQITIADVGGAPGAAIKAAFCDPFKEETGIEVEVVATVEPYGHEQPPQLPPPVTIGIYDLGPDGHSDVEHQHIDFVYFTRPANGASLALPDDEHAWVWVHEATLRDHPQLPFASCGAEMPIEDDVRRLALASIVAARDAVAVEGA